MTTRAHVTAAASPPRVPAAQIATARKEVIRRPMTALRFTALDALILFAAFAVSLFALGFWIGDLFERGLSCRAVLARWAVADVCLCAGWLLLAYLLGK